ncbi:hypothetical protein GXW82_10485 [Streptacidiphilus sp. 4-A2]|nr:hypothetical protein [Streptacidiphilus sp. 4-A2]
MTLWSLAALTLGRRVGLTPTIMSLGIGPALRTSFVDHRILIVRRFPFPVLSIRSVKDPGRITMLRLAPLVLVAAAVQGLAGWGLLLVPGPFGVAAGTACLGTALVRLVGVRRTAGAHSPGGPAPAQRIGDAPALQVIAATQRSLPEARRLIDGWSDPDLRGSTNGRMAELLVLMGEGRYREAMTLAEALAPAADLTPSTGPAYN